VDNVCGRFMCAVKLIIIRETVECLLAQPRGIRRIRWSWCCAVRRATVCLFIKKPFTKKSSWNPNSHHTGTWFLACEVEVLICLLWRTFHITCDYLQYKVEVKLKNSWQTHHGSNFTFSRITLGAFAKLQLLLLSCLSVCFHSTDFCEISYWGLY
jgi:hypothetical protein